MDWWSEGLLLCGHFLVWHSIPVIELNPKHKIAKRRERNRCTERKKLLEQLLNNSNEHLPLLQQTFRCSLRTVVKLAGQGRLGLCPNSGFQSYASACPPVILTLSFTVFHCAALMSNGTVSACGIIQSEQSLARPIFFPLAVWIGELYNRACANLTGNATS